MVKAVRASSISKVWGSGGANLAGSGASGNPSLRDTLLALLATGSVVTYAPSGVDAPGVYTDWATLCAEVADRVGPLTILFDPGGVATTITLPAGTWAFASRYLKLSSMSRVGTAYGSKVVLNLPTNCFINTVAEIAGGLFVQATGTTSPFTFPASTGTHDLVVRDTAQLATAGVTPLVSYTGTGAGDGLSIYLFDASSIYHPGAAGSTVNLAGPGTLGVYAYGSLNLISQNSLGVPTNAQMFVPATAGLNLQSAVQVGILDTGLLALYGDAVGPVSANVNSAPTALTDADQTLTVGLMSGGLSTRWFTSAAPLLTANRVKTLSATGALINDQITITRNGTEAFTLAIANGGTGGGTIVTLPVSKQAFAKCQFDGTNWLLREVGTL